MSREQAIAAEIPRLRRYARALTGQEAEADDLVQDTLERALSRMHLWRDGDSPRRWLFTILHNIHIDRVRGLMRRPAVAELDPNAIDESSGPVDGVSVCEVSTALQRLVIEQRQVLLLVALEGLSYAEASRILQVPIGTVMSRLARARERMRELLDREPLEKSRLRPQQDAAAAITPTIRRIK